MNNGACSNNDGAIHTWRTWCRNTCGYCDDARYGPVLGSCSSVNKLQITTATECEAAAVALNIPVGSMLGFSRTNIPGGCVMSLNGNRIDFNENLASTKTHDDRKLICESAADTNTNGKVTSILVSTRHTQEPLLYGGTSSGGFVTKAVSTPDSTPVQLRLGYGWDGASTTRSRSWTLGSGKNCYEGHGATTTDSCPKSIWTEYADQSTTVERCKAECLDTAGCDGVTVFGIKCYKRNNMDLSRCGDNASMNSYKMDPTITNN